MPTVHTESHPHALKNPAQANFYEKALFVKPTWRPLCVVNATTLPFALCFYPHSVGEPISLWWLGAKDEIRLFEPKALQSS